MFSTLLIANRGEIACRVIRTARRMGIRTVAVYSDADANALHVAMADEAIRIGPPPVRESYLNGDAILAAAHAGGAEAIHPGYGFLSENAAFAEACAKADVRFVGPPPDAIRAMGLKDRAKILMEQAGVAVVPGYLGDDQTAARLVREAGKIGYPVLIKAVAGGGGKGMRRVDDEIEFTAALESAQREAKAAFGDDRVLIEKYVNRPRHIEIQIFADMHGDAVHLFERDCSVQRRHQKVIEEAPAPGMNEAMRERMGEAAIKAARAVGYVGAGTVEFIADASEGLKPDRFWFMEMNTRLQVEHPATEMVTGLDLVEWQLRVAAGEQLPQRKYLLYPHGHAIEARLYAENPRQDFLPSVGRLERLRIPESQQHLRIDTGVREGDEVSVFYDPMIAKVIAWAETREDAAERLAETLSETQIAGVQTNTGFLVRVLRQPEFIAGEIDTGFIERHRAALIGESPGIFPQIVARAALFLTEERVAPSIDRDPWSARDGFRLCGEARETAEFVSGGERIAVEIIHRRDGPVTIRIAGVDISPPTHASAMRLSSGEIAVMQHGETWIIAVHDALTAAEAAGPASDRSTAPMPGKIVQVLVREGECVKRGQSLAVLEAMKMEHTLKATADAIVSGVDVAPGDQVVEGASIVRFATEPHRAS